MAACSGVSHAKNGWTGQMLGAIAGLPARRWSGWPLAHSAWRTVRGWTIKPPSPSMTCRRTPGAIALVHASAERVRLPDASFDIVFCDHGAMTFADPYRTVPEAARLLRPGGLFAFNHGSPILSIAWAADAERAGDHLIADYFGMHRFEYSDSIDFNLPYGEWIRLFRENDLTVEDLIEPRPAPDATSTYRDDLERDWARRWPAESIWRLRRT
jgi:SAM-dependent methyltransferase